MPSRRRFLLSAAATVPAVALNSTHLHSQKLSPSAPDPAPILALKDRSGEAVPISAAERDHRATRARELLAQNKLAALTVTGGTTLQYFLGIPAGSRSGCLRGQFRRAVTRSSCARRSRRGAYMKRSQ